MHHKIIYIFSNWNFNRYHFYLLIDAPRTQRSSPTAYPFSVPFTRKVTDRLTAPSGEQSTRPAPKSSTAASTGCVYRTTISSSPPVLVSPFCALSIATLDYTGHPHWPALRSRLQHRVYGTRSFAVIKLCSSCAADMNGFYGEIIVSVAALFISLALYFSPEINKDQGVSTCREGFLCCTLRLAKKFPRFGDEHVTKWGKGMECQRGRTFSLSPVWKTLSW